MRVNLDRSRFSRLLAIAGAVTKRGGGVYEQVKMTAGTDNEVSLQATDGESSIDLRVDGSSVDHPGSCMLPSSGCRPC